MYLRYIPGETRIGYIMGNLAYKKEVNPASTGASHNYLIMLSGW